MWTVIHNQRKRMLHFKNQQKKLWKAVYCLNEGQLSTIQKWKIAVFSVSANEKKILWNRHQRPKPSKIITEKTLWNSLLKWAAPVPHTLWLTGISVLSPGESAVRRYTDWLEGNIDGPVVYGWKVKHQQWLNRSHQRLFYMSSLHRGDWNLQF